MAIFNEKWARIGLNGKNPNFYIDLTLTCLVSVQLTGICFLFKIKKLQVDLLPKTLKLAVFQYKKDQKMALNGKYS